MNTTPTKQNESPNIDIGPTPLEILEGAESLLKINGWCTKNYWQDEFGYTLSPGIDSTEPCKVCLEGALLWSAYYQGAEDIVNSESLVKAINRVTEVIPRRITDETKHVKPLATYNDEDGRTKDDVLTTLSKAIEREKQGYQRISYITGWTP